jgi:hypothetical protein
MRPEFPPQIPDDYKSFQSITLRFPEPCAMLRLEQPCSNDAYKAFWFVTLSDRSIVIPVCEYCLAEDPAR